MPKLIKDSTAAKLENILRGNGMTLERKQLPADLGDGGVGCSLFVATVTSSTVLGATVPASFVPLGAPDGTEPVNGDIMLMEIAWRGELQTGDKFFVHAENVSITSGESK